MFVYNMHANFKPKFKRKIEVSMYTMHTYFYMGSLNSHCTVKSKLLIAQLPWSTFSQQAQLSDSS